MAWIMTTSVLRDSLAINHFISKARSWNNCLEVVLRCPTRHHSLQQLRAKSSANQNHEYLLFPSFHFQLSWIYHYYLLSVIFFYTGHKMQFIEDDHPTTARKKFGKSKPSIFTIPLPCRKHIFCNFMGLEMITSISDNLNDL